MATKKELERRIAALEAQVATLLARPSFPTLGPVPAAPLPQPSLPGWSPQIWCGTGTSPAAKGTIMMINGAVA